jgi:hypothetical protein
LDLGDIHKKYAHEMEYLARVRDGSDGGGIVNGYWSNQVIGAELNSNELIPLYQDLYSQNAPDFISENAEIIKAIDMVGTHVKDRGIWVIDRGGDRKVLYNHLLNRWSKKRFIIRMVGSRHLICGRDQPCLQMSLPITALVHTRIRSSKKKMVKRKCFISATDIKK